jgi:hypothetical protein
MNTIRLLILSTLTYMTAAAQQTPLYKAKSFTLYADSVVQGNFVAKALSPTALTSNYKSPANEFLSPAISFKFSINGKDNEMKPGVDHHFTCIAAGDVCETPIIKFGQQYIDTRPVADNTYLKPQTALTIRLDLRSVLEAMNTNGYYTTYNGDKIYKQDFKGVYVAGGTVPLSWDFDNLVNKPGLQMTDKDGDGIYETSLILNDQKDEKSTAASWSQSKDLSAFPAYKSPYTISDALYNLALEEMINAVEPDSTFRTGKEWAGVWTRDISYSIILSMAHLQPAVAKNSLLRKVKNGKIIQDTGTGGAYPASTDRMIWAVAAYELYKVTGDKVWLKQAYIIIKNSVEDDLENILDKSTGMMKGESSFLDWREQTYPKWMQPVDIYESECLGTNAVHYQANIVLAEMAALVHEPAAAAKYKSVAAQIKAGINNYLWMPNEGYYAQFRYGRNNKIVSPRSEALGEALTVLFGIAGADKQDKVISNTPVMDFGIPCIYPQIPNIPPYHNNAVWPFVQSYWALAAAKVGNEPAVMQSIAAIYRPAALWLTNKENFVASNGDFAGTQINSSNMLWSLSGSIALVHKLLFGIQFNNDNISFNPFVPQALAGKRSLTNFRYRNAVLDIFLEGFGNTIQSFTVDGKKVSPTFSAAIKGKHTIRIVLANKLPAPASINLVDHYVTIDAPRITATNNGIEWNTVKGAAKYWVIKNGTKLASSTKASYPVATEMFGEYQVMAVDEAGVESFASEPLMIMPPNRITLVEVEQFNTPSTLPYKGFSGGGFVEISKTTNRTINIPVDIKADGVYSIALKYANGNGPINTENKCAIRTLKLANKKIGTVVLPQRGNDEWSNWGWTNENHVNLTKGKHTFTLSFEPANENMNGDINQAMIDYVKLVKL